MYCRFEKHGLQLKPIHRYDLKGSLVEDSDSRWQLAKQLWEKYGKRTYLLGWHEIRQLLYEYLPPNTVEFDKQVSTPDARVLRFQACMSSHYASMWY